MLIFVLEIFTFIGITSASISSSKKRWMFISEEVRKSAVKSSTWHCRNPVFSDCNECIKALGPLSHLSLTSGVGLIGPGAHLGSEPVIKSNMELGYRFKFYRLLNESL